MANNLATFMCQFSRMFKIQHNKELSLLCKSSTIVRTVKIIVFFNDSKTLE